MSVSHKGWFVVVIGQVIEQPSTFGIAIERAGSPIMYSYEAGTRSASVFGKHLTSMSNVKSLVVDEYGRLVDTVTVIVSPT